MCRDVDGSGRRCPCDTSEARRLRRKKQAAVERNTDRAVQSPVATEPSAHAVGTSSFAVETSEQQVKELRAALQQSRLDHDKFSKLPPNPMGVFTAVVNGERITTRSRAEILAKSEAFQEEQVSVLGQHVQSLVQKETGFTDSDIRTVYESNRGKHVEDLKVINNRVIEAKIAFLEKLPTDLQNARMGSQEKLAAAAEVLTQEEFAEASQAYSAMVVVEDASSSDKKELQNTIKYGDAVVRNMAAENLKTTRKVLASLKPMGGEVKVDESSNTAFVPALQAAGALYPSDWVSASNDSPDAMIVRENAARGHYKAISAGNSKPEMALHSEHNPFNEVDGYRIAVHEFAHRLEHTADPFIFRMEEQFLKRRSTLPDGTREPLKKIVDLAEGDYGSDEVVYPDNFTHVYMGKTYDVKNREILSMGMESVFCGTHGGLMGLNDYKPDPDMKNFILGMLAS